MSVKKFLLLQSNPMFMYTLHDIESKDDVMVMHKKKVSNNNLVNLLFNIHNSAKIQRYVDLPFKSIWDRLLFDSILDSFTPDYIVFTVSWYSNHLLRYFRTKCKKSKIIFRFSDTIKNGLGEDYLCTIERIKSQFDGVLVYSQEDAVQFGFTYHSVGYSPIINKLNKPDKYFDVVFIGADKGRIDKIRRAYNIFITAGLSCFFYVTLVNDEDRNNDGIIYADRAMTFPEYLSYVIGSKCLFELVQDGSSGRTFRMMESIMFNKLLITNCTEITKTGYYDTKYVQLYEDVSEIKASFVVNSQSNVDYKYRGDFSPQIVLDFIERSW